MVARRKKSEKKRKRKKSSASDRPVSDVILDYAAPLLERATEDFARKEVIDVAISLWNAAILTDSEGEELTKRLYDQAMKALPEEDRESMGELFWLLVEHKQKVFGDDKRVIYDYQIVKKDGRIGLKVKSSAIPTERKT